MIITIQFSHQVLFVKQRDRLHVALPSAGHGATASFRRDGVDTSLTLPRHLSLAALPDAPPGSFGPLTVSGNRLPDLRRFVKTGLGQALTIAHNPSLNCLVELQGGTLVASEPTFASEDDRQYADKEWRFDGGYTSQLTNHVNYVVGHNSRLVLRDRTTSGVFHEFQDGDFLHISNMDPDGKHRGGFVHDGLVELREFRQLYDVVDGKLETPSNPTTPHLPRKDETPEKPICAGAFVEI